MKKVIILSSLLQQFVMFLVVLFLIRNILFANSLIYSFFLYSVFLNEVYFDKTRRFVKDTLRILRTRQSKDGGRALFGYNGNNHISIRHNYINNI